jgi:hypothetical protein
MDIHPRPATRPDAPISIQEALEIDGRAGFSWAVKPPAKREHITLRPAWSPWLPLFSSRWRPTARPGQVGGTGYPLHLESKERNSPGKGRMHEKTPPRRALAAGSRFFSGPRSRQGKYFGVPVANHLSARNNRTDRQQIRNTYHEATVMCGPRGLVRYGNG